MAYSTIPIYHGLGMIRAVFECIDVSSNPSQLVFHCLMQCLNVSFLKEASRYAGLIRDHEYKVPSAIGGFYGLTCAIYPRQFANLENITFVLIEHSVPIEENCWPLHFR